MEKTSFPLKLIWLFFISDLIFILILLLFTYLRKLFEKAPRATDRRKLVNEFY